MEEARGQILEGVSSWGGTGRAQQRRHGHVGSGASGRYSLAKVGGCLVAKSCPTLCSPRDCRMPDFPVFQYLLEFAQTHVH